MISPSGSTGPYIFEDDTECLVAVNTGQYKVVLQNFVANELHHCDLPIQFQQHWTSAHTAWISIAVLNQTIPQGFISRYTDINWPDLLAADFFPVGLPESQGIQDMPCQYP